MPDDGFFEFGQVHLGYSEFHFLFPFPISIEKNNCFIILIYIKDSNNIYRIELSLSLIDL
jgi:hypothetical protein